MRVDVAIEMPLPFYGFLPLLSALFGTGDPFASGFLRYREKVRRQIYYVLARPACELRGKGRH
jgi:hypothetical protein